MTAHELFATPASLFATPMLDVERAKRLYLAQFVHIGCGGAPVAFVGRSLGCTCCAIVTTPINDGVSLERALAQAKVFKSMVV